MNNLGCCMLLFPFIAFVINNILCKKISYFGACAVSTICLGISAISSVLIFIYSVVGKKKIYLVFYSWFHLGEISINYSLYIDSLVASMVFVVNIVSFVVHLYSFGYMRKDKNFPKFLSFLSLFTFLMLVLVCADNFVQLFLGWEGVGLCSYLLIGYYVNKKSANEAAIKAFIVNRISDFAFLIGIMSIFLYFRSVNFLYIFQNIEIILKSTVSVLFLEIKVIDLICISLFLGCMGKSAQIGLHVWLPDAMEGPTPVSALIHAATMVTAGVFLIAKCSFIFEHSPFVLSMILVIGSMTCLFAALIAITQTDIKKIIAYSTCSQLGYMFMACGLSAYNLAIFHLITHAFFKALLFLAAGNIIYATNHQQNIFKLGNLSSALSTTYVFFLFASLALLGIFPLSGFYSKDLIIEHAYLSHRNFSTMSFVFGNITAFLTALYSFKIIYLVFHKKNNMLELDLDKTKDPDKFMHIPLYLLLLGTLFFGMILYYLLDIDSSDIYFADKSVLMLGNKETKHLPVYIVILPMVLSFAGIIYALTLYKKGGYKSFSQQFPTIFSLIKNKFFFDQLYNLILISTVKKLTTLANKFDKSVIDDLGPVGISKILIFLNKKFVKIQTGYIENYLFYVIFSVIAFVVLFLLNYKFLIIF